MIAVRAFVVTIGICIGVRTCCGDKHACDRECEWPPKPMECHYEFTVEWYYTMSKACYDCPYNQTDCSRPHCVPGDGAMRPIISVNRQLPGPAIRVCHKDTVIVEVYNRMENEEGVTIHWHGLYMKEAPHMDGVSMLTQCPIPAKTSFTYEFIADPPGTHWWHSHAGMQLAEGMAGPLIVKRAGQDDPHFDLYDVDNEDYTVFVSDWLHQLTLQKFTAHQHFRRKSKAEGTLINGKGVFEAFLNETSNTTHYTPREVFTVEKGKKYRFRIISSALFCSYELTIDGHDLIVISSDGADFEPYKVTSLVFHEGERYDVVVDASSEISNYWFRIQGRADCKSQSQQAILKYFGAPEAEPSTGTMLHKDSRFLRLNPWNEKESDNLTQISSMRPVYSQSYPENEKLKGDPDQTRFIGFDFMKVNNPTFNDPDLYPISMLTKDVKQQLYTPQLNNISFATPPYPMLTQSEYIKDEDLCDPEKTDWNEKQTRFCIDGFCSCPHVIDIKIGNLVELVIYDEGRTFLAGHPMHLHGQHFAVVAMDKVGDSFSTETMKELHANGTIKYDFAAPLKDTISIPDGGYVVVRFIADNPGIWLFHCHQAFHAQIGMKLVFRVGLPGDWVPLPDDFPKCGTWPAANKRSGSGRNVALGYPLLISYTVSLLMSTRYIF